MKSIRYILFLAVLLAISACTDDESFSKSRTDILTFATDTVKLDTVFSKVPAPTKSFWIYNKSSNGVRCSQIKLEKGNQTGFRVNVDGEFLSAERGFLLRDIEIRKGDSLRVFVEVTTPIQGQVEPKLVEDNLVFSLESGVTQKVNLNAWSWDAEKVDNLKITSDQTLSGERPIIIYGGITVDSTATLTLNAGTTLYFHDGAGIDVYGKLLSNGTAEAPIVLRGDRLDRMFDYLPYDLISGMWKGVHFYSSSLGNKLNFTDLHSAYDGVVCDSSSLESVKLNIEYSTIHNCQGYGLKATHSVVGIIGSQITNTLHDCASLNGGYTEIVNCTFAQFYPFDSKRGMALHFTDEKNDASKISLAGANGLACWNTIITGFDKDVVLGEMNDTTGTYGYYFESNVLRTPKAAEDDVRFVNNIWETEIEENREANDSIPFTGEKMFVLVSHETQHYDFHLNSLACAVGKAATNHLAPHDRDGKTFNLNQPDIGCYSLSQSQKNYTKNFLRKRKL